MSLLSTRVRMLQQLDSLSIQELVDASDYPQAEPQATTYGMQQGGVGWAMNPSGDLQLGGDGAHTAYLPDNGIVSTTSPTIALSGHTTINGTATGKTLSINGGGINPELIPPVDPLALQKIDLPSVTAIGKAIYKRGIIGGLMEQAKLTAARAKQAMRPHFAPSQALLTVATDPSPASDTPSVVNVVPDLYLFDPLQGPPTGPYVVVPAHTHVGAAIVWGGVSPGCAVPLGGVDVKYLVGHNRNYERLVANETALYAQLLENG